MGYIVLEELYHLADALYFEEGKAHQGFGAM